MGLGRQAHQLFVLIAMDEMWGIRFTEIAKQDCGPPMDPREHVRITGFALKNWALAQVQDSIAVALLWLLGLWILKVPWALLWAGLAAALQIVPHLGPVLSLVGPVLAALLRWHDWEHPLFVLLLYAVIVVVDGLLLQPYIMRRVAKVPIWASIFDRRHPCILQLPDRQPVVSFRLGTRR